MPDLFIHRVELKFADVERATLFEMLVRKLRYHDHNEDIGSYPLLSLSHAVLGKEWVTSVYGNARGWVHIVERDEECVSMHFAAANTEYSQFFQDIPLEKYGVVSLEGDYFHEFGEFEVGRFCRDEQSWHHEVIHKRGEGNLFQARFDAAMGILNAATSNKLAVSFDVHTMGDQKGPQYSYDGMWEGFIHDLEVTPREEPHWWFGDDEDIGTDEMDIKYTRFANSLNRISESLFQIRYSGRITIHLTLEEARALFSDIQDGRGINPVSFDWRMNRELDDEEDDDEWVPDENPPSFNYVGSRYTLATSIEAVEVEDA